MFKSTVHIAGPPALIGNRLLQRCIVCGFKLVDSHPVEVENAPGVPISFPHFKTKSAIRVDETENGPLFVVLDVPEDHYPPDICTDLLEH